MQWNALNPGQSVKGNPIRAYNSFVSGESWLYLLGGVHGDEIEGMDVLERLMECLAGEWDWNGNCIAIPVLNPDGKEAGRRTNEQGVDLNRNLPASSWCEDTRGPDYFPGSHPLSEPENLFLDSLFKQYPPQLIMSFHSWKPMLNYNGDCREVAEFLGRYNQYSVCGDIEGHPTPGSLGDYGPEVYGCPVLTLEFPKLSSGVTLERIWQENASGFKALFGSELLD